jgi:hypothetical protein
MGSNLGEITHFNFSKEIKKNIYVAILIDILMLKIESKLLFISSGANVYRFIVYIVFGSSNCTLDSKQ